MPATYERINTTTASGSSNTMTISSIPGTYTHLRAVAMIATASAGTQYVTVRVNNDGGNNYSMVGVGCDSGANTVVNTTNSGQNAIPLANSLAGNTVPTIGTGGFQMIIFEIPYYTAANAGQSGSYRYAARDWVMQSGWTWSSTSAITRIDFIMTGAVNFAAGSTLTVYGYLKA